METIDRVRGSFYGAALGDAMGAPTETMTPAMILQRYGKYLDELVPAGPGTFLHGYPAAFVTDDFSLAYDTALVMLEHPAGVTDDMAKEALIRWSERPVYSAFAGPSTRTAIAHMKDPTAAPPPVLDLCCDNSRATNGSAMKIFPAGLRYPGQPEQAVQAAVTLCLPTHNNTASLSAAAAIAAAVSVAVTGAPLQDVMEAGFYGAREGAKYGKPVAVATVLRRMELAVSIAKKQLGWEQTMLELAEVVGAGLSANEAVPCVFGILEATGGDVMSAIKMGVNIGNDTDTIATMVGAIAGAMCGADAIPAHMIQLMETTNHMAITQTADSFTEAFYP